MSKITRLLQRGQDVVNYQASSRTTLLIIGAGPFGLSLAAYAQALGISYSLVGFPMHFWRENMPQGMLLRSTCNWSLDPSGSLGIDAYLNSLGKICAEVEPLSRDFYLEYTSWFQDKAGLIPLQESVTSLSKSDGNLRATFDSGAMIEAESVVLALGFRYFAHTPPELTPLLPPQRTGHTCDVVNLGDFRGERVLIVGGRQSAFEWAALLLESGAAEVHLSYRHDTPEFKKSDWLWVDPLVEAIPRDPGWFRRLPAEVRQEIGNRFWQEGRLKLEPWLAPRIHEAHLHSGTTIVATEEKADGLRVRLNNEETLEVDRVILATGYKVDLARVPLLSGGDSLDLEMREGFPVLDEHFQTNVEGLYVTSLAATQDFGAFLGFTVSARAAAQAIGDHIESQRRG